MSRKSFHEQCNDYKAAHGVASEVELTPSELVQVLTQSMHSLTDSVVTLERTTETLEDELMMAEHERNKAERLGYGRQRKLTDLILSLR